MTRKFLIALLPVVACAGLTPAQAAPTVKTVAVSGTVAPSCSLSALTVVVNSSNGTTTFAPNTVTAYCNTSKGGVLSVSAQGLKKGGSTSNYTFSVSGWGSSALSDNTANSQPVTQSQATLKTTTLSFACTAGCTGLANGTWASTITLGLTVNP